MSAARTQALIEAPPERIWELVGDPRRHPEWWPRVIEVQGRRFEEGEEYAQVTKTPGGRLETSMRLEQLDDMHEIHMRCTTTGMYARWLLTPARGNTFVEVEFGMEPIGIRNRALDSVGGRIYFRRWLQESLAALKSVA